MQFILTIIVGLVMLLGDEYFIRKMFPTNQKKNKKSRVKPSMSNHIS